MNDSHIFIIIYLNLKHHNISQSKVLLLVTIMLFKTNILHSNFAILQAETICVKLFLNNITHNTYLSRNNKTNNKRRVLRNGTAINIQFLC